MPAPACKAGAGVDADGQWRALMAAAQDGHGGAYRRLLEETSQWLQRYFERRLPPHLVDDALQETLLAVHRRRHTYDPARSFTPWLAGIARRKWIDQLRAMARDDADPLPEHIATGDHGDAVVSASVLGTLLDQLRPVQARAITLVRLHGYTFEEASRETGLSLSAIKMNVRRGLARLSDIIEKTHDVE